MKIKLKALRVNADMTQKEVADMVFVTRETIRSWESHKTFPNVQTLQKLCMLYGCTLDDVFIPSSLAKSENVNRMS